MRVSVLQPDPGLLEQINRLNWLKHHAREQAKAGADVLILPESFLSGYNFDQALHGKAEPKDGNFASQVRNLAHELGLAFVYGYPELDGGRVYNSAIFIDDIGTQLANHRKVVLRDEIEPNWFETGDANTLFRYRAVSIALMICYECEFPEAVRGAGDSVAGLVLVLTASGWQQVPRLVVLARAYENSVFMVYANYGGVENGHEFAGQSCIVDPYGNDLACVGPSEGSISAKLNLGLVAEARTRLPYLRDHRKIPVQTSQNLENSL